MNKLNQTPLQEVHGLGAARSKDLNALGIHSVSDLIEYFPFRYEDYRLRDLSLVEDGEKITVQAKVYSLPQVQRYGRNKSRMTCKMLVDEQHMITTVWFNRHFLKDRLIAGKEIILSGKWDRKRQTLTVSESEFPGSNAPQTGALQPVYSVGGSITQRWIRKIIQQALQQYSELITDPIPATYSQKHNLIPRKQAILFIHRPQDASDGTEARRRLVYEELFLFQLKLMIFRSMSRTKADGIQHEFESEDVRKFVRALPFQLTDSQKKVTAELLSDLRKSYSMNRLLQGDVGSGKTVVAATALYANFKSGYQGAMMVPTEILAEQHYQSLQELFEPYGLEIGLLVGSLTNKQRRDVLASLQSGLIDIVIGTHALIQEKVHFRNLGLVVTDEQHRFGVNQRSIFRHKGFNPDVLTMTATPIPRTLAITAFGDMDVSTLKELPKGRKEIKTYWVKHNLMERVLGFIQKELQAHRQAYVICPLIEESDKIDVQNAIDLHAQIQEVLSGYKVGLLHGRQPADEKEEVMSQFSENEVHVLVSTTVVEVGVNVPNATIMVIYDADRFGLSQLHQLRGRVGRGQDQSYCILIADPKSEIGKERMRSMTITNDGFEIARMDLELRGPGDFFGTKQSGMPEFRLADLAHDFEMLEMAREDAAELVRSDEFWTAAKYLPLRELLDKAQLMEKELD
ncbi:ATP-dependent DNA helicase RecG [Chengkuizengella axinellae]|uniref:ATP-dependent DNA helicase RecG n=1 Tax=Chengkuizengella axinellae TaxID=3064388 RepID=A0ABT9IW95_9BACL|nr:ATP-dependent DNA helicase RecG [Chengkuizengella sp. 2205SS18-9]MDP5273377.1 ATP-dependent DNA helicase RecG [Chengkuizengella sp. 2205SS18-9]